MLVGLIVLDNRVKFCYSSLNRFRGIPPEAVGGAIVDSCFAITLGHGRRVSIFNRSDPGVAPLNSAY